MNIKKSKEDKKSLYIDNLAEILQQFIDSTENFKEYAKNTGNLEHLRFSEACTVRLGLHRRAGVSTAAVKVAINLAKHDKKILFVCSNQMSADNHKKIFRELCLEKLFKTLSRNINFISYRAKTSRGRQLDYVFMMEYPCWDDLESKRLTEQALYPTLSRGPDRLPGTLILL
jgi:hypothetical protein